MKKMEHEPIKVLLIEDNPGDARLIREMFAEVRGTGFHLERADRLSTGLERLAGGGVDVVLLDLSLPDSHGLDTFVRVHAQAPQVPVILLTGLDDEALAAKAMRQGAQDYLVKGQVEGNLLARSLRYAIERQRLAAEAAKVSELEAFTYGIAHDLRSPMVSIEGFSRLLRADIQNQNMERVQEDIRLIESGVRKMQHFLNRTLEYSRAGHQVKPTDVVPFGEIVAEVIAEFTEQLRSIGATVSIAETFPTVRVDRMRIMQVLTNLLQNSIHYRDKAIPLRIEIGYWLSEGEAVFFVRDNGTGIDASETEKVFDLFYRGTAGGEGSGVGLAIVATIIKAHGGRIWVQQGQSGKGATMCFTLPQQSDTNKGNRDGKD